MSESTQSDIKSYERNEQNTFWSAQLMLFYSIWLTDPLLCIATIIVVEMLLVGGKMDEYNLVIIREML